VVSLLTNKLNKAELEYSHLLNIGVYALTPVILIGALVELFGLTPPYFWVIYSLIYSIYLIIVVAGWKKRELTPQTG
jgi:hypothetical protein